MSFRTLFRPLTAKFNDNHDTPTPDDPPHGGSADRLRGGYAEVSDLLSKWGRLDRLDPKSREHHLLLTSLLDNETYRKATTSLEGEEATIVLDILAKALDRGRNPENFSRRILRVLRNLAHNACQVPNRYKIDRNLPFDTEPVAFASGGFSDVRRGTLGGQRVAIKIMRVAQDSNTLDLRKSFCKETVLWKNISHPNILGLIAVEIDSETGRCFMVSELMLNGNIFNFIQHNSVNRLRLLADVAEGLRYLHGRDLIHGDIKGSNILITNATPPRACLSDFGFSAPTPTNSVSTRGINFGWGTPPYMAPELIYPSNYGLPNPQVSKEADIYAFGMVVYEVVTGVRPFGVEGLKPWETMFLVVSGKRPGKPEDVGAVGFGRGIWELVEKCWSEDRTRRPNAWDLRLPLGLAATLSSPIPPGPRIVVPRDDNTYFVTPSPHPNIFDNGHGQSARIDPEGTSGEVRQPYSWLILDRPTLERSITVARHAVGGISPAVRDGFGMLGRLPIPRFITNFRARLNLGPLRKRRLRED